MPNSLFKSSLSAVRLNLTLDCLKPATATSPLTLLPSILAFIATLTFSCLASTWAFRLKATLAAPLGKAGSLISTLPASLGRANTSVSILPVNGEENLPDRLRAPCLPEISPEIPELSNALGEPFISSITSLAFRVLPPCARAKLRRTSLPLTSSFRAINFGASSVISSNWPCRLPLAASLRPFTRNSLVSSLASKSPAIFKSSPLNLSTVPCSAAFKPFARKRLFSASASSLPLSCRLASNFGLSPTTCSSVSISIGSPLAIWPVFSITLSNLKWRFVTSSVRFTVALLTTMPSISNLMSFDSSLLIKSSKLVVPSLKRTILARTPSMRMVSTTNSFLSRGMTARNTLAPSIAANSLSPLCSERETLPRSAPSLGQNASLISPSIFSVRCFFSLTILTICGL